MQYTFFDENKRLDKLTRMGTLFSNSTVLSIGISSDRCWMRQSPV